MASNRQARCSKQNNIMFTLPISCQICLGKVKQPVLCPNLHVFCSICLEIWLNRNSQCPTCRVHIGPDNPVKHIIGEQEEDEDHKMKSSPDFRRARFDLLYQEYEDQLEQMKKENIILTTENNILIAQLKDIEDNNDQHKTSSDMPSSSSQSLQISDGPSLLMLTKKLQEAQKLYSTIKAHMTELKRENCKVKDENMHLTRENKNLRLEIGQRSPKKFGRFTVATLETRISEQEKEIRQLKKALECSDSYIEKLQRKLENSQDEIEEKKREVEPSLASKARFRFEPKHSVDENFLFKDIPHKNKHCKVLFGDVVNEVANKASNNSDVSSTDINSTSSQKQSNSKITNKIHEDIAEIDAESLFMQSNTDSRNMALKSEHAETHLTTHHHTESQKEFDMRASEPKFLSKETDDGGLQFQNSRKVHINVSGKSSDTFSFDLEMPSPASSSLISDSHSSLNKELAPSLHTSATLANPTQKFNSQARVGNVPIFNFDGNCHNLVPKKTVSFDSKVSTIGMICQAHTSEASKKSKRTKGKAKKIKSSTVVKSTKQNSEDVSDSSHLSIPDITMEELDNNLNDTNDVTELDNDDLDTSMTPELTYCLKLMNQAEKKISLPATKASSSFGTHSSIVSTSGLVTNPFSQTHYPSFAPETSNTIHKTSSSLQYLPASTKNIEHSFAPLGSIPSSWEQQFYSSLRVNPYKYTTANKHQNFSLSINHNAHANQNELATGNEHEIHSSSDFKKSATRRDFKFSDPVIVGLSESNKPLNPFTFSDHKNLFHPSSIHQNSPPSSIPFFVPATPCTFSFISATSKDHNANSNASSAVLSTPSVLSSPRCQAAKHASSFSSSLLELPSDSSQCAHKCDNISSFSLSNSELEWPEDKQEKDH